MCPAEGRERSRRSAGNTKKRKTCSQQKVTRIKRFWSKHFRPRNKTIFTEYDRKKSRLSSVNIILFLCLKAFTSQACYVNAFLLGTSLANLFAPWGRRVLVHALLPGTRQIVYLVAAVMWPSCEWLLPSLWENDAVPAIPGSTWTLLHQGTIGCWWGGYTTLCKTG